jgi:hypothetical protein
VRRGKGPGARGWKKVRGPGGERTCNEGPAGELLLVWNSSPADKPRAERMAAVQNRSPWPPPRDGQCGGTYFSCGAQKRRRENARTRTAGGGCPSTAEWRAAPLTYVART